MEEKPQKELIIEETAKFYETAIWTWYQNYSLFVINNLTTTKL